MTEDEAKAKWCPFARPALVHRKGGEYTLVKPHGRDHTEDAEGHLSDVAQNCIGSACMAWREIKAEKWFDRTGKPLSDPGAYAAARAEQVVVGGFCGLSGAQQ